MIGIHTTRNNFSPLAAVASDSTLCISYKNKPEDFIVIEVDENGITIPTTIEEAQNYSYVESSNNNNSRTDESSTEKTTNKLQTAMNEDEKFSFDPESLAKIDELIASIEQHGVNAKSVHITNLSSDWFTAPSRPHPKVITALKDKNNKIFAQVVVAENNDAEILLSIHPCFVALAEISSDQKQTEEVWSFLQQQHQQQQSEPSSTSFAFVFKRDNSRYERTYFHELLFKYFPFVQRRTRRGDSLTVDLVRPMRRQRNNHTTSNNTNSNTENSDVTNDKKEYFHFILEKKNVPSFSVEKIVGKHVFGDSNENKSLNRFVQTCGNKDKRAITFQRVSVPVNEGSAKFFSSASSTTKISLISEGEESYARIFHPKRMKSSLALGSLGGNVFRVRLHFSTSSMEISQLMKQELTSRLDKMKQNGVANFFGPQRFGFGSVSSSSSLSSLPIGFLCACGLYEEAVLSMFENSSLSENNEISSSPQSSNDDITKFKNLLTKSKEIFRQNPSSQGADLALKIIPQSVVDVVEVLRELRRDFDYKKAMCNLSFNLRQIRVHSAQSLLFNEMLSEKMNVIINSENGKNEDDIDDTSIKLPMIGSNSTNEEKKQAEEILNRILSKHQNSSKEKVNIEAFINECKSMLGTNSFPGTSRQTVIRPSELELVFDGDTEDGKNNSNSSGFSAVLTCKLPAGSFVSVVIRELLGGFPMEP